METRIYKGDKWTKVYGSRIPIGTVVNVVHFCPRRTVIVEYMGERILTKLWCLSKIKETHAEGSV
jgi:hypothetical protein